MLNPIIKKLINWLPSSVMKPVSKFIINTYLNKYANIIIENGDELNKTNGPVIIVGNHLSNSDGLVLNKVLKNIDPYFLAGVKLNKNPASRIGIEAIKVIPIHPNTPDIEAIRTCVEKVKSGSSIFMFPEGTRSRTAELMEGKKGVILIARKCGIPIIPIGMAGTEKLLPINDNDMGDEIFQKADVHVNIGKAFYLPEREKGEDKEAYNEKCINTIMKNIAVLIPSEYRGIYK